MIDRVDGWPRALCELVSDGAAGDGSLRRDDDATHARIHATAFGTSFDVSAPIVTTLDAAQRAAEAELETILRRALAREFTGQQPD